MLPLLTLIGMLVVLGCSVTRRGANWLIGDGFFRVEKELAERALPKNEIKDSIYIPQKDHRQTRAHQNWASLK